jgi:tetratricopeptide (TPR) repeat protein
MRQVVAKAAAKVNQLYQESGEFDVVLASLMADSTLEKDVVQTAIDIAGARGDRPRGPMKISGGSVSQIELRQHIDQGAEMLVELVEQRSGILLDQPIDALAKGTGNHWSDLAKELAEWPIESLLTNLIAEYPEAHHFFYVRGQIRVRQRQWREAQQDLAAALARTPGGTAGWHWQAYQLASLHLYLDDLDRHRQLCEQAMDDFGDSTNTNLAERTAGMCLGAADSAGQLQRAAAIADEVVTHTGHGHYPWFTFVKAYADYRRGHYASAIDALAPAEDHFNLGLRARALCVKALCLQELGRTEEAEQTFTAAEVVVNRLDGDLQDLSFWNDWTMTMAVYRETVEKLRETDRSTPSEAAEPIQD